MRKCIALSGSYSSINYCRCMPYALSGVQADSRLKMSLHRALAVLKANSTEEHKPREGHSILLCACETRSGILCPVFSGSEKMLIDLSMCSEGPAA